MKRAPHRLLLCFAVATLLTYGLPAQNAEAAFNNRACEPDEVCLWMDANYQGCSYDGEGPWFGADLRKLHYTTCPSVNMNDNITSYRNMLRRNWLVLWEDQGKGATYCIAPQASGNVAPGFNDKASSMIAPEPSDFDRKECRYVDSD